MGNPRPSVGVGKLALPVVRSKVCSDSYTSQQAEANPPGRQLKAASLVQQY